MGVHVWMPGVGLGPGSTGIKDELEMYKKATEVTRQIRPCGFSLREQDEKEKVGTRHTHGHPWVHPDPDAPWVKEAARIGRRSRRTQGIKPEIGSFLYENDFFDITDKLGIQDDAAARELAKQVERKVRQVKRDEGQLSPEQFRDFDRGTFKRQPTPLLKSTRFYHRKHGEAGTRSGDQTRAK